MMTTPLINDELPTEDVIIASLTLEHILKKGVYRKDLDKALKLGKRLDKFMKGFFNEEGFEPVNLPEYPDLRKTIDLIVKCLDEEFTIKTDFQDEELVIALGNKVRGCLEYMRRLIPNIPKGKKPSDTVESLFMRTWIVVNSPFEIVYALEQGVLARTMVKILGEVYPELYEQYQSLFTERLIASVAKDEDYDLPWQKKKQMHVFMGTYPVDSSLQSLLQKPKEDEQKIAPPSSNSKMRIAEAYAADKIGDI
jgi:hypothetical protein